MGLCTLVNKTAGFVTGLWPAETSVFSVGLVGLVEGASSFDNGVCGLLGCLAAGVAGFDVGAFSSESGGFAGAMLLGLVQGDCGFAPGVRGFADDD